MSNHPLRRAPLCVAAAYGALLASTAGASHTAIVGPGDSLDSLARKYHVAKRDIARANGISLEALLRDGRRLTIPDPPATVTRAARTRQPARIHGDRITVRRGPNEGYRRLTLVDHGAPVTVTASAGEWRQIELPNGSSGWVRADFVTGATGAAREAPARSARQSEPDTPRHRTRTARADDTDSASERRLARRRSAAREERARERRRERMAERRREARRERVAEERRLRTRTAHRRSPSRVALRRSRRGRPEAGAPDADSEVVRTAYSYRGTPYHFGGSGRRGFDCSGFTSYVYGRRGVSLPHSAAEQFGRGRGVSRDTMKPGDLVFFHTTRRGISHVGIYAGDGRFVHASSGGGSVRVDSLRSGYYSQRFRGARRVK